MNRKLLPTVWILAILGLVVLSQTIKLDSTHFFGIADDREQTVSFSYPVEIVQTHVVEGGEVQQGTLVLEVRRQDLSTDLNIIKDQIQAMQSSYREDTATAVAELSALQSRQAAELAEIDLQIDTLKSQMRLNEQLLKEISGTKSRINNKSPIAVKIQGLEEQRVHIKNSLDAQIENLSSLLNSNTRPTDAKLAELVERKIAIERQVTELRVQADFTGRIGSINFKPGETVAPYQPILTVHSLSPKYVKGYIHENVFNDVMLGQKVWVTSSGDGANGGVTEATVEGLGSRIVEYPQRLKKNALVSAWGREAVIRLTGNNSLLLGEKVVVTLKNPNAEFSFSETLAALIPSTIGDSIASTIKGNRQQLSLEIHSHFKEIDAAQIEASGIIRGEREGEYLVVTDEQVNNEQVLLQIDHLGEVQKKLVIPTRAPVDDLESISRYRGDIFVLASLNGQKADRRHLLRMRLTSNGLRLLGQLNIHDLLQRLAQQSADSDTRHYLNNAFEQNQLELESHLIRDNALYLGFKKPLNSREEVVIVRIEAFDELFSGGPLNGRIWRTVALRDPNTGVPARLSDMAFHQDKLLLLGVSKNNGTVSSHLWVYQPLNESLIHRNSFEGLRAEGVSLGKTESEAVVVFDGSGKKPSRLLALTLQ